MKCLNCGRENSKLLCNDCLLEPVLEKVFNEICDYEKQIYENEHVRKFVETFENSYDVCSCIPDILELFDDSISEYYTCRYYRKTNNELFESVAINYIDNHSNWDMKKQHILMELLEFYLYIDFVKPKRWCEFIRNTDNLCSKLYYIAAKYFSMVGDYDFSDEIITKALGYCNNSVYDKFLFSTREEEIENLNKLKKSVVTYRTTRPYWPNSEKRRREVAAIYEKKGIKYPRITKKTAKIKECDFQPICESLENNHIDYCAFWCAEVFSISAAKDIYQIAAIKVQNGKIIDEFQSYIKPSSGGTSAKKAAAKEAGIDVSLLYDAQDVDQIMPLFFDFVGGDVLISTGALGNQGKLISRAARYMGKNKIDNLFFDLLDYAADISSEFDMQNNTRGYLLEYFGLSEGRDSLEKARKNVELYNCLKGLEE